MARVVGGVASTGGRRRRGGARTAPGPDSIRIAYTPDDDGQPDPGEIVWTWVPYEDDPSQGKDRPVLVIACNRQTVIALPLTSKDHDHDAAQEARAGRVWMDVGTGDWDRQRRPSEVRLNRALVLDIRGVRREGGALPRPIFDAVVTAATPYLPDPQS
jgi:hypothetical protein